MEEILELRWAKPESGESIVALSWMIKYEKESAKKKEKTVR